MKNKQLIAILQALDPEADIGSTRNTSLAYSDVKGVLVSTDAEQKQAMTIDSADYSDVDLKKLEKLCGVPGMTFAFFRPAE